MPPLQAAFPLAQVLHRAVREGQHLELDGPGVGDEPLDQQRVVAEGGPRLSAAPVMASVSWSAAVTSRVPSFHRRPRA
jgi:hypothetical protein